MSVLRDAMELGYGADHFMVTGEDFPDDWEDPIEKKVPSYSGVKDELQRLAMVNHRKQLQELKQLNHLKSLKSIGYIDTKEGWLKKNEIVCDGEESYGIIDGVEHYGQEQTNPLSELIDKTYSDIEKHFDAFFSYIKASNITDEKELSGLFQGFESQILSEINGLHDVLYIKSTIGSYMPLEYRCRPK